MYTLIPAKRLDFKAFWLQEDINRPANLLRYAIAVLIPAVPPFQALKEQSLKSMGILKLCEETLKGLVDYSIYIKNVIQFVSIDCM